MPKIRTEQDIKRLDRTFKEMRAMEEETTRDVEITANKINAERRKKAGVYPYETNTLDLSNFQKVSKFTCA